MLYMAKKRVSALKILKQLISEETLGCQIQCKTQRMPEICSMMNV